MKKYLTAFLVLMFISSINATPVIDFNEQDSNEYQWIVDKANNYPVIRAIAKDYSSIRINYDDEIEVKSIVIVFEDNKIKSIEEDIVSLVDTTINITKADVEYLIDNYNKMSWTDKIKFAFKIDLSFHDMLNCASYFNMVEV